MQCPIQPNMLLKLQLDRLTLTPVRVRGESDSKTIRLDRQIDRHTDGLSETTFLYV